MLNKFWSFLVLSAILLAVIKGQPQVITEAALDAAADSVTYALGLIGLMSFWLGVMNVAEKAGLVDALARLVRPLTNALGIPSEVLPLAILRPLSGGGALGVATELIHTSGPDSFIGRLASTMQGTSDTTFFVLTLYFGSVGIKNYRYALALGLTADCITFLASVFFVRLFFGY